MPRNCLTHRNIGRFREPGSLVAPVQLPGRSKRHIAIRMSDDRYIALQVVMMPRDANPLATVNPDGSGVPLYRTVFGGVLLSYLDQAGAVGAIREVVKAGGPAPQLLTVAINRVEFKHPVLVGDVVKFKTQLVRLGRTSITMNVLVEAERGMESLQVTEAELVYVGVDPHGPQRRPKPLLPEPALLPA